MNLRFASTAVDQTRADYSSTAWLNKPLLSAQHRTEPLFTANCPDVREGDTQFGELFYWQYELTSLPLSLISI